MIQETDKLLAQLKDYLPAIKDKPTIAEVQRALSERKKLDSASDEFDSILNSVGDKDKA